MAAESPARRKEIGSALGRWMRFYDIGLSDIARMLATSASVVAAWRRGHASISSPNRLLLRAYFPGIPVPPPMQEQKLTKRVLLVRDKLCQAVPVCWYCGSVPDYRWTRKDKTPRLPALPGEAAPAMSLAARRRRFFSLLGGQEALAGLPSPIPQESGPAGLTATAQMHAAHVPTPSADLQEGDAHFSPIP
jgi:hypothetical protein